MAVSSAGIPLVEAVELTVRDGQPPPTMATTDPTEDEQCQAAIPMPLVGAVVHGQIPPTEDTTEPTEPDQCKHGVPMTSTCRNPSCRQLLPQGTRRCSLCERKLAAQEREQKDALEKLEQKDAAEKEARRANHGTLRALLKIASRHILIPTLTLIVLGKLLDMLLGTSPNDAWSEYRDYRVHNNIFGLRCSMDPQCVPLKFKAERTSHLNLFMVGFILFRCFWLISAPLIKSLLGSWIFALIMALVLAKPTLLLMVYLLGTVVGIEIGIRPAVLSIALWVVVMLVYIVFSKSMIQTKCFTEDLTSARLQSLIQTGAIRFVRGPWMKELADSNDRLKRRQQTAENASTTIEESSTGRRLKRLKRRQNTPDDAFATTDESSTAIMTLKKLIVVSYGWMTPGHPDPDAHQLEQFCRFIKLSSHVVFWDFVSLFQVKRNPEQEELFQVALSGMHMLYGHCRAKIVRLTDTAGQSAATAACTPYRKRGWPLFETAASSGAAKVVTISNDRIGNPDLDRPVPMSKEIFAEILETKVFTSRNADLQRVKELYESVYDMVSTRRILKVGDWGDKRASRLVKVLGKLPKLRIMQVRLARVHLCWQPEVSTAAAKAGVAEIWPIHEMLLAIVVYGAAFSQLAVFWLDMLLQLLYGPVLFGTPILADHVSKVQERRRRLVADGGEISRFRHLNLGFQLAVLEFSRVLNIAMAAFSVYAVTDLFHKGLLQCRLDFVTGPG